MVYPDNGALLGNKNDLSSHEKAWRKYKHIVLSEKKKSVWKGIPSTWHSVKGKTIEMVKRSVAVRGSGEERDRVGTTWGIFRAVKLFFMIL